MITQTNAVCSLRFAQVRDRADRLTVLDFEPEVHVVGSVR
jgi:hypothetical protein